MQTITPPVITKPITLLCGELSPKHQPAYVPVDTEPDAELNECFAAVDLRIARLGGSRQYGWAIWEWPNVLIEAEFHAVWRSPDGQLVDVSLRESSDETTVLFLPDDRRQFNDKGIDNVRRALRKDLLIDDFIMLAKKRYRALYAGELTGKFGEVQIEEGSPAYEAMMGMGMVMTMIQAGGDRKSRCLCGSGRYYKNCHSEQFRAIKV